MTPTKFRFIWPSGFREEDFYQISTNQKQELPVVAMFVNGSGRNEHSLQRTFHRCYLSSFGSFGLVVSEEKIFRNRPIRNKNCLWWLHRCFIWQSCFREECFLELNQSETRIACDGHVFVRIKPKLAIFINDFPQMTPTKFRFIWPREEDFFRNRPNRNKNCLWRPCLLTDQNKMSNLIEDLPQMLPIKFPFIWSSGFRGEDFQKSNNQKQELPVAAMFNNGSGRNGQSLQRTLHRCSLPSFSSFGQAVSEEKNFWKSTNQKQELPVVAMFVNGSGRNEESVQRILHKCFLPSFSLLG